MIKPIYALLALFIIQLSAYAQHGDARTTTTKIADLLAQQPAETTERFEYAIHQLEGFAASEISTLLQQLTPPGEGNNAAIEYATNSYGYYVLLPGKEMQRATFVEGAVDALGKIANHDNKGYVMQLLQNAGDDTAIGELSAYLKHEYLCEKASRALARIGTRAAGDALLFALSDAAGFAEVNIVNALGFMAYTPAEQAILTKVGAPDLDLQKAALYTLSQIGGKASEPILRKAAAGTGYVYDVTQATAAYVNYIHRLIENDETALAVKLASRLFKTANSTSQVHTRIAALKLLTTINQDKEVKSLVKAAKDDNVVYRNAALGMLEPYLNNSVSSQLVRGLVKTDTPIQADILRYLGNNNQVSALTDVRRALDAGSPILRKAAVEALNKLGGEGAVDELINRLPEYDEATRDAVKQVLLTSKNNQVVDILNNALSTAEDPSIQVLLIEVLGQRGAGESVPTIFGIIRGDGSTAVKSAAYKALPQIVRPDDMGALLDLLVATNAENVGLVQKALVVSVNRSSDKVGQTQRLIVQLKAADRSQQPLFFPVLSGVGGSEALTVTTEYASNDHADLRGAATFALANWIDPHALPKLIGLSRKKVVDSGQLDAVLKGVVRLVSLSDMPAEQKVLHLRDAFEVAETVEQKRLIIRSLETSKTYNALIFAGKYLDDEQLKSAAANTVMNIALDDYRFYGADVTNLLNKVISILSGNESSYLREAILRHLDELPNGAGYVSLFNGKDLGGWKGLVADPVKRALMDDESLAAEQGKADQVMLEGWYAQDGVLHFNGKGDNIVTVNQYGDFELLVDWKLAKDGKDGDAGIYLRGTPQVQIWDTSRVEVGAQVGSGGLYNNQQHESKPLKVADNALGEWNTFRITMVGDKVTVYLNGELVTTDVVLENYWDRSQPIFPIEQLELQAHGTHVSYRDIYIRELPNNEIFTLSDEEKGEGFKVLFDGTNLDEWTGNTKAYAISDERTLAIYPTEGSGGNLYTKEEFADFVYRFEFRLTPGANNGIGIRAPLEGDAAYEGMEIQVLDDEADMYSELEHYQYHGSVYGVIAAKRGYLRPIGAWNQQEIYIKGNKIRITLNDTVILDGDLEEASKGGTLDKQNHPGLTRKKGHIAFLGHGSEVHFKNIRIKRL